MSELLVLGAVILGFVLGRWPQYSKEDPKKVFSRKLFPSLIKSKVISPSKRAKTEDFLKDLDNE